MTPCTTLEEDWDTCRLEGEGETKPVHVLPLLDQDGGGLGSEAQVGGLQQATTTKCCKGSGAQEGRVQHGYKKQEWDTGASQESPCPE